MMKEGCKKRNRVHRVSDLLGGILEKKRKREKKNTVLGLSHTKRGIRG